ncbi:MAG: NYN domain-containing protein [Sphingomonas adhaesiva]|uniref:NYN domain-containing protein n=1 Tax=Sphingomonas adhaesiva TaxID=28212 RepID=UPI002FFB12EF
MATAVVIDGAFFLRRFNKAFPGLDAASADDVAFGVVCLAAFHVSIRLQATPGWFGATGPAQAAQESAELYRIFFYDCPPLTKRIHTPVGRRSINLATTPEARLRLAIHDRLHRTRKVAVRLGRLNDKLSPWRLKPQALDRWQKDGFAPADDDFELDVIQKGVDMRLGLDIAAMAYKRQVNQIVLVAADADFVPPAKLARREGVDIVLDPLGAHAAPDLLQHVDGVRSCRLDVTSLAQGAAS